MKMGNEPILFPWAARGTLGSPREFGMGGGGRSRGKKREHLVEKHGDDRLCVPRGEYAWLS